MFTYVKGRVKDFEQRSRVYKAVRFFPDYRFIMELQCSTRGIFFVCNNTCVLLIEYVLIGETLFKTILKLNDLILDLPC